MKKEIILESEVKEKYDELITIFKKLKQLKKDGKFNKDNEREYNSLKKGMEKVVGSIKLCEKVCYQDPAILAIFNDTFSRFLQLLTKFYESFVPNKQRYSYESKL